MSTLAVIIPVLNEVDIVHAFASKLLKSSADEIIFVDGGSTDGTIEVLSKLSTNSNRLKILNTAPSRGLQLNIGALESSSDILLFLHTDTTLPDIFPELISEHLSKDVKVGSFLLKLEPWFPFRSFVEKSANLRTHILKTPFGDQSIFANREFFIEVGLFDNLIFMEDIEFMSRKRVQLNFKPLRTYCTSSSRKWVKKGLIKVSQRHLALQFQFLLSKTKLLKSLNTPKSHLGIFMKYPESGKVKTRLGSTIGNKNATKVYMSLVKLLFKNLFTANTLRNLNSDASILYSPVDKEIEFRSLVSNLSKQVQPFFVQQSQGELGDKIFHALLPPLDNGYKKSLVIGTDCPWVSEEIISQALSVLDNNDFVFGPATDGGFYLMGTKTKFDSSILTSTPWSQSNTLETLLKNLDSAGFTYGYLRKLSDIDTEKDIQDSELDLASLLSTSHVEKNNVTENA